MHNLPSHQHLFTSLIDTLEAASIAPPDATAPERSSLADRRRLLLTLHVLFPTLLLPALDLLDRRLVTQISLELPASRAGDIGPAAEGVSSTAAETTQGAGSEEQGSLRQASVGVSGIYLVRSVATTLTRRTRDALSMSTSAASSRTYLVRLDAWHCSCPSLALETFPARPVPVDDVDERESGSEWLFGGRRPGGLGGNAPCCKHLLACLLARRWSGMTDAQVEHRSVSKEELAGIITDM